MQNHFVKITYLLILSLSFTLLGCGGGSTTTTSGSSSTSADNVAPVVMLKGEEVITLFIGDTFSDAGITATDNIDGDISTHVTTTSNLDVNTPGEYTIHYTVTDSAGNSTTLTRKLIVYEVTHTLTPRSGLTINEIMASNASTIMDPQYKSFSDWIELYNNNNAPINIGGYYLSDDANNATKWRIPTATIGAHSTLLIWADKQDSGFHTNFSLDSDGETLFLYDSNSQLVDTLVYTKQKSDVSCAKMGDRLYFMTPTPGSVNVPDAMSPAKRTKKPTYSKENGFYTDEIIIELKQEKDADIYYTIDGSIPTKSSLKYTAALPIDKTTVIRARSYYNGFLPSKINTHTFLINESTSLPVVSLAVNDSYLYDDQSGIYILGSGNSAELARFREANYGQDWERPASFEYFVDKKLVLSNNVGIKVHGRYSRAHSQKSLNIYARGKYDGKYLEYPFFPNKQNIKKVKSMTLRNSGGDWGHTMLHDGMVQSIIKDTMTLDYQDYQPAIVFINGKYWGIQNIRERSNGELIRSNHDIKTKNIDLLAKTVENQEVYEGDNSDYAAMFAYIHAHGLSSLTDYNYIKTKMDMDNYMEYMITEMFIGADDWPLNNNKYWKERTSTAKWRWILFDTDSGFQNYKRNNDPFNYLLNPSSGGKNTEEATFLFRSLMQNATFKNSFITKFREHLDTTFSPSRVVNIINTHEHAIENEIERHINRWKNDPTSNYSERNNAALSKTDWESQIEDRKSFINARVGLIRNILNQQ